MPSADKASITAGFHGCWEVVVVVVMGGAAGTGEAGGGGRSLLAAAGLLIALDWVSEAKPLSPVL